MNEIFVFGSNLAGRHGMGAALYAKKRYGAVYGKGIGRHGNSYAIPTKDQHLKVLSLENIAGYVRIFLDYAKNHPDEKFLVTKIGCGLAGYKNEQIAPMFANAPENCILHNEWIKILNKEPDMFSN